MKQELRELQKQAELRLQRAKSATAGKLKKEEVRIASVLNEHPRKQKKNTKGIFTNFSHNN